MEVAYCGVDLGNDTDTTMVVDSVMVQNGERPATHVAASVAAWDSPVARLAYGRAPSRMRHHPGH